MHKEIVEVTGPHPVVLDSVLVFSQSTTGEECGVVSVESVSLKPIPENSAPVPLAMESAGPTPLGQSCSSQPECPCHPARYNALPWGFCHCHGINTVEVQHAICCGTIGVTILLMYLILNAVF